MAMSELFAFLENDRAGAGSMIPDSSITSCHNNSVQAANRAKRGKDFLKHQPGQALSLRWRQRTVQPLLCIHRSFNGQESADHSLFRLAHNGLRLCAIIYSRAFITARA